MLIVLSGLPASGRSAVAEELGRRLRSAVLPVDPIEAAIWRAGIRPSFETGVAAYEVAATLAQQQLLLGHEVIVDAVNALEVARGMWRQVAARSKVSMRIIEVICSDLAVHRRRLEARVRVIDGFPEPTWAEVMDKRAEWGEWSDERLVLDSLDPLEFNVQRALDYRCERPQPAKNE